MFHSRHFGPSYTFANICNRQEIYDLRPSYRCSRRCLLCFPNWFILYPEVMRSEYRPLQTSNPSLSYLETGKRGFESDVRPWFWILSMFLGPVIRSLTFQWYSFINTKTLIQGEAILTQLIFEHSLRIRFKAEHSDKESGGTHGQASDTAVAVPETAPTAKASITTEDGESNTTVEAGPSDSSKGSKSSRSSVSKLKGDGIKRKEKKAESVNLVGKLNNLVTTDMRNILETRDFLMLCKSSEFQRLQDTHSTKVLFVPLQISLCCTFLYRILGWRSVSSQHPSRDRGLTPFKFSSAFVGFACIVLLFPLPGYMAKLTQDTQRTRIKMVRSSNTYSTKLFLNTDCLVTD